jgi:sulfur-carrier protein
MVTILFFAQLREQLGCEKTQFAITSPTKISALREELVNKNPHWSLYLGSEKLLFSVNQVLVRASHLVNDGDEVAFFPPVTGG